VRPPTERPKPATICARVSCRRRYTRPTRARWCHRRLRPFSGHTERAPYVVLRDAVSPSLIRRRGDDHIGSRDVGIKAPKAARFC
jgi:hypothetical protein